MTATRDLRPSVHFPPPFLFVGGICLAWLLEKKLLRIHLVGRSADGMLLKPGIVLLVAGLIFMSWGLLTFAKARTGILPGRPANQIVSHGPYRISRNPMYAGMATAYIGGVFILNSGWALLFLPVVMLALYRFVIRPEEQYLSIAFPTEYGEYRRKVRRFI